MHLKQVATTPGGVPVLSMESEQRPCARAARGELRGRAWDMGQPYCICPGCDRSCGLPVTIGKGDEFVLITPKGARS